DLKGNSNLCANCHQSRRPEPLIDKPGEATFKITSTHYGPHHGAQANVVAGVGFAEIAGSVSYPAAGSNYHLVHNGEANSCTGCHMGTYDEQHKGGGHTWTPNLSACIECHGSEMANYDYAGTQTAIHGLLEQLRDKLVEHGLVAGDDEHGYHPVVGTYPMNHARAFFNWTGLDEDRSLGAHNPKYVKALLLNSIAVFE
ncbi:MAG TPA: hypothetical protein VLA03_02695, partial [Draconibacterium sp.]|nr:hypothetical protein [Draconibacterium sp.]